MLANGFSKNTVNKKCIICRDIFSYEWTIESSLPSFGESFNPRSEICSICIYEYNNVINKRSFTEISDINLYEKKSLIAIIQATIHNKKLIKRFFAKKRISKYDPAIIEYLEKCYLKDILEKLFGKKKFFYWFIYYDLYKIFKITYKTLTTVPEVLYNKSGDAVLFYVIKNFKKTAVDQAFVELDHSRSMIAYYNFENNKWWGDNVVPN
jgi:hypothetical protein